MLRRTATVLGAAAAALLLTTTTATAADSIISVGEDNIKWRRSCDTAYFGAVGTTYAITRKYSDYGSCKGDAWVRAYTYSGWTSWVHSSTEAEISSSGGHITRAQHKGCSDCTVYSTELRWLD
ncbi:hypothetical protein ACIBU0_21425 [Streptomyces sp. NPDC049627]|uniref:hypothetical protein n=1 Tax=Streptomyces sp. NPDC049627 TaxID=3365595 RepID=UPI0037951418